MFHVKKGIDVARSKLSRVSVASVNIPPGIALFHNPASWNMQTLCFVVAQLAL
jgi:hypothetical protein